MKKIVSFMAGAAVVAMAVPAAAAGPVYQGSVATSQSVSLPGLSLTAGAETQNVVHVGVADTLQALGWLPGSVSLFTISSDGFSGNIGEEDSSITETFTLKGHVTPDCAYYVGANTNRTIEFGEIGINTLDTNPNAAFMLAGGVPSVEIDTNLAGCNTRNRVAIGKSNLRNASAAWQGYDQQVFTDTLKITAKANYKATAAGTVGNGVQADHISLGADDSWKSHSAGAWKSPMKVTLAIQNPGKALVAGSYEGSVSIELLAY